MNRPKNPPAAAVVAAQARSKAQSEQKIVTLPQTRTVIREHPTTGHPQLIALFPSEIREEPNEIDLSFLLDFPDLEPMFNAGFLRWGGDCEPTTRKEVARKLSHFLRYIRVHWGLDLKPGDIDDELLTGYRSALINEPGATGKPLSANTVADYLGAVRIVLGALDIGVWAKTARSISSRVPSPPPGGGIKTTPTEVLGLDKLIDIIAVSEKEVLEVRERIITGKALVAEGRARTHVSASLKERQRGYGAYHDLAGCLAGVDLAYPKIIPSLGTIEEENPQLARAIHLHTHISISSYFYPAARDLVPFVLLLTIATVFNPETVLTLDWQDFDFDKDHAGRRAIEIKGEKHRAAQDLVRLMDPEGSASSKIGLEQLLICLREISYRLRSSVAKRHSDRIFLFGLGRGNRGARTFDAPGLKKPLLASQNIWEYSLKSFLSENHLPKFTLGQIRPSVLDLVQFIHGDLETAQKVGNHKSPTTTWKYYTSDGIKKRYRERIGQIIILRERWFETGGDIDPRRLTPDQDKGAATPGFSCLNPFDSPRPNQTRGKLCKDYGGCPSCPLAAAHLGDPICVGQYMALERAIYRSQPAMSAKTWLDRWVPVLVDLKALQALIPATVLAESRKISVVLPNVG